jgi:hypothetical protein
MTLNEKTTLAQSIKETLKGEYEFDYLYNLVGKFTERERKYAWALIFNNKVEDLKNLISRLALSQ